ncbi:hypothetical protein HIV01_004245 [Lysobacter arenosi]|uniref:Uncharacterized protein n=1 Tax=Lysobacter arenosi TaxID=2795387 RepID=A0ABX7RC57_9GAMM|nr:hypothetical protein [Lysobacter arenosi]QSX75742.1 hypothetical protein HIV01_004245 [Lysobacter arenosi]
MTTDRASLLAGQAELADRSRGLLDRKRTLSLDVASGKQSAAQELGNVLREIDQVTRDRGVLASALEELESRQEAERLAQRIASLDRDLSAAHRSIRAVPEAYLTALRAGVAFQHALATLATAASEAAHAEAVVAADPRAVVHSPSINVAPSINALLDAILQGTAYQPERADAVIEALRRPDGVETLEVQMEAQVATALRKVQEGAERKRKAIRQ